MKGQESDGSEPPGETTPGSESSSPEHGRAQVSGARLSSGREHGILQAALEDEVPSRGSSPCSSEPVPESDSGHRLADPSSSQHGVSYRCLLRQNQVLLTALEELQLRCAGLKRENSLLRKSCFPETQEKVRHLKRKNAELAVIAKRLEERARKLQEANLKVVNAPAVAMKGSCAGICKKTLVRQRTTDLREQACALLAKDKQINALQQECQELQAKITSGKEGPPRLPLLDFRQLLRESQKEVLRLQRQIALKNVKGSSGPSHIQTGPRGTKPLAASTKAWGPLGTARAASGANGFSPPKAANKTVSSSNDGEEPRLLVKKGVAAAAASPPEIKHQIQRLESELRKKRKQCESLEHEVRKKHKRYAELETQLQAVKSDNVRLLEENAQLQGQVEWIEKVESENADLRLQVSAVTEERDSALQKTQELENRLESLGQALKHMRDVAGRRQQLEQDHEKALQALRKKQEEVRELQQAQAEARKEHEGAVQLLEARVRELENQCRNHTEQFNFLSQELKRFRLQTAKTGPPLHSSSPSPAAMVASEVAFASCPISPSPSPQRLEHGFKEKDRELLPVSPLRCSQKIQPEEVEETLLAGLWLPEHHAAFTAARSPDMLIPPIANRKPVKRLESQSSSSRSESIPTTSPKSCPTPEVDTASEMEELDIDSVSLVPEPENHHLGKLQVFLARYSYNPFDGPNENPEAELPLTAGEYIYIYGEMDEDGFFEGELMDGRRGLVPSNFVERVSDDDLVTFLPGELNDLSQSSPLDRSFLSASLSSGERSDLSINEASTASTVPSRLEGDPRDGGLPISAVPYPAKVTLIREFGSGLVVGWDPPYLPAGFPEVQSYQVYVDAELRQNVKSGFQTKAVLEKLDLKTKAYRVSVQSVSESGASDCLRCTFLVGKDFALAPGQLLVRTVEATSAEISWTPSNSNFFHTVYLNGKEHGVTKPGVYWYTFRCLTPNTSYAAKVEVQPQWTFWESGQERQEQPLSSEIHFTTALAGSPDAPLDVRVEPGPSPGILTISWLPVTIDAEGSSNGVRVTGYAVYANGQKVMEVTSPTAGSVLADVSQLQTLQASREVSVRTVSLYGESSDSVPAQIPLALLEDPGAPPSHSELSCLVSRLSRGDRQALRGVDPTAAANNPIAKFTSQPSNGNKSGTSSIFGEASHQQLASPVRVPAVTDGWQPETSPLPQRERDCLVPSYPSCVATKEPGELQEAAQKDSGEDSQDPLLAVGETESESVRGDLEMDPSSSAEPDSKEPSSERMGENAQSCPGEETLSPSGPSAQGENSSGDAAQNEMRTPDPMASGPPGRVKLLKENPRDDPTILVPRTRREGEKRSDPGNRPLNLLTDHTRNSDLSDIMEEEEEEEEEEHGGSRRQAVAVPKWKPGEYHSRENGEKLDSGDVDSDEEILERILEMPLPKNCSKALFSIPEVTEEEEEEEDWEQVPRRAIANPPNKKAMEDVAKRPPWTEMPSVPLKSQTEMHLDISEENLPDRGFRREGGNEAPTCLGSWEGHCQEERIRSALEWKRPGCGKEKLQKRRQKVNTVIPDRSRSVMANSHQTGGGGLYRARSLKENLDVITNLGADDESELRSWMRPRPSSQVHHRRTMPQEPRSTAVRRLPLCLSPESLEINVEYDSEEDLTVTSTPVSQLSSDGRAEGSPTDCEEGWSDSSPSSPSGSVRSGARRELKRCSSWEEESMEWSGSPGRSPRRVSWRKRMSAADATEERSRSLERSPSLRRAIPGRPFHEDPPKWTRDIETEPLNSTSWRAPTRRGRRPRRKNREGIAPPCTNSGAWRSPSPETMDEEDSVRLFVALFDYDPISMSPNSDAAEEELPFQEGQILKVYGHKDADGFYKGECAGRTGYIPCNMVSEVQVESEGAKKQLLQEGRISTNMLAESLDNGGFSPPRRQPRRHPPKPRRSKKVERNKQEAEVVSLGTHEIQDLSSEEDAPRTMLAIFDYNPQENSPNPDAEAELRFCAGDIVTVLSSLDDDGFYYAEIHGQKGLVPSNFLEALVPDGMSLGKQQMRKRRVQ
ncbi:peripheral-type benzodiazepine receptor-associated protein 1 isoform X2 [Sceloporus undulatus]|uniref:peripheral-type benzodiazepine receptor-associated protein 1 isoform X2 n=1 Tax=Sceloporus undulatus TaxID=8520 RepID=UPI001C4B5D88|nr:peripheral-type benzodiazepine receptor-associated protein 1 isoform X2 [Sceloporus undulatus]